MKYSLGKGIGKGIQSGLIMLAAVLVATGISDVTVWDLIVKYVQPLVGTVSIGMIITMVINYFKVKTA